ncbi:MAG: hypothetical protein JNM56_40455 [Planctomycetia bacterium]|nr:hypothetical protein [Planctomycetia bacterium]
MQQIIIDKELLAKLHDLREPLELLDEHGRRLGIIQPDPSRDRELLRTMEIPVSEEELRRIEKEIEQGCKLYTTAEVLAHLRSSRNS